MMFIQNMVVALLVLACCTHAAMVFMPLTLKKIAVRWLLRLSLPEWMAMRLKQKVKNTSACNGCSKCGDAQQPSFAQFKAGIIFLKKEPSE